MSMQRSKSDINMQQRMFEPKQLAQSEMVQDLPKKGNQELVWQEHKKLERCTSDLGSDRMNDNTVTVYIARRPKNEIKGKEISKEKEMEEEKLVALETEEKSKGRINSIVPVEEIKGNEFLEELGDADMMEGLEDIDGWDDLKVFNEFGEELELEQRKENSSNVECNVVTLPIEFMAKQNITDWCREEGITQFECIHSLPSKAL